ncbi:alpha/beta fold hydrolase [Paenibacillus marinisediminis]
MNNYRVHGDPPYQTILLHGGPGAIGEMEPLAKTLSASIGIIESLQTKTSISELVIELNELIEQHSHEPVVLVGYSWGAWLGSIYASLHPDKVRKLILVSSGPFEESYASEIMATRFKRMSEEEMQAFRELQQKLLQQDIHKDDILKQLGQLISNVDGYDSIFPDVAERTEVNFYMHDRIWQEASALRKSGQLLQLTANIRCPVSVFHGDYDPHPVEGVIEPLTGTVQSFHYTLLEKCGHKPWTERHARDTFVKLLLEELSY